MRIPQRNQVTTPTLPEIIFQDRALLVLNKPAGWIVNQASTTGHQPTVQAWLKETLRYPLSQSSEKRSGIVHRLDKETSGLLLLAKTFQVFSTLQLQFKQRTVRKSYLALVHGRVEPQKGSITVPVGRLPWNRERFGVLPGGRPAQTFYRVDSYYHQGREVYSLLHLKPKTGRTHQLRIHLKYLGHPIVSDSFYAGRKTSRSDRLWCPRLFLHADSLAFIHPQTNLPLKFRSHLPADLKQVLSTLQPLASPLHS